MKYLSVNEIAQKWGLSERSVRNYCANNRIPGSFLVGKIWKIPFDAIKPERANSKNHADLLKVIQEEKKSGLSGGIYHKIQIDLTYNSNHIEGSTISHDQTRYIFETNTIAIDKGIDVDDVIETVNHFRCINFIIEQANNKLSEKIIKQLHFILKSGTKDSRTAWFIVGDYKKVPNEVGGKETTAPKEVSQKIKKILQQYNSLKNITFYDIVSFHYEFESIHPFQDGNGRVGRLIMFKECLKNKIVPFIISEDKKMFYYQGLKEWRRDQAYLLETCLAAQDDFKLVMDYFKIKY